MLANRFVAEFMGQTDFIQGIVTPSGIATEIGPLIQPVSLPPGSPVEVALRADDVSFRPDPAGSTQVAARYYRGATNLYALRLPSGRIVHSLQAHTLQLDPGAWVQAIAEPGHPLAYFPAENQTAPDIQDGAA